MILDHLQNSSRYESLHPGLKAAFDYLRNNDWRNLPVGMHSIDGDRLYIIIEEVEGRGRILARLEAHRRRIDIQLCLSGHELIGWKPLTDCREITEPYDEQRDIMYFGDRSETWNDLVDGWFAVFFPEDAHAPLAAQGPVKKAIVKIAVDY